MVFKPPIQKCLVFMMLLKTSARSAVAYVVKTEVAHELGGTPEAVENRV